MACKVHPKEKREKILKNDTLELVNNSTSFEKKGERKIINSSIRGAPHASSPSHNVTFSLLFNAFFSVKHKKVY